MSELPLDKRIAEFLAAHHVVTLATCEGGAVHAASLMYALDGFSLIWMSDPKSRRSHRKSRHSRDLRRNPRLAATMAPDYTHFAAIRGLQIAGPAVRLAFAG